MRDWGGRSRGRGHGSLLSVERGIPLMGQLGARENGIWRPVLEDQRVFDLDV